MATTWKYGGFCACGCGQKTRLAPRDHQTLGWKKDEPYEFVKQHHNNHKRRTYIEEDCGYETLCHVWQGEPSQRYPSLKIKGKPKKVHAWVWEQANGPIPPGLVLHHRCENPRCCRLDHLELATTASNAQRARHTKLTMEKAEQIRHLAAGGEHSYRRLAEMYGVSRGTIEGVVYGHTWRPVDLHRPQRPPRRQD